MTEQERESAIEAGRIAAVNMVETFIESAKSQFAMIGITAAAAALDARPSIQEDVREGVAEIIERDIDVSTYEDYGGFKVENARDVADAVLSYLESKGWGPKS